MRARWIAALLVTLAACDDDDAPDPCAQRLASIEGRLEAAAAVAEPAGAPLEVPLPRASRGRPAEGRFPLLVVGADEVRLGERVVGGGDDVERIARTLGADLRRLDAVTEGSALTHVALWVDPATEVHRLAQILARAPEGLRFVLLVRGPIADPATPAPGWVTEALTPPPLPVVREDRAEGMFAREDNPDDPLARRRRIDRAWERATRSCEGARDHLPVTEDALGAPLGPPSVAPLMDALRECGCDVELDAIEAVARASLRSPEGPVWRVTPDLRFGLPSGEGREVQAGADDVAALVERLTGSTDTLVWIRAE